MNIMFFLLPIVNASSGIIIVVNNFLRVTQKKGRAERAGQ
jgi:hypothetical protein